MVRATHSDRTIIDILRKGNQELFHSSMIAWLLDPTREHGLGTTFLDGFATLLAAKGAPELGRALDNGHSVRVLTEHPSSHGRYDIVLDCGPDFRLVLENKTKTVGGKDQLERYGKEGARVVALGLCDVSFAGHIGFPLVCYPEILELLRPIADGAHPVFGVLVRHYRDYLERELRTLELMSRVYARGELGHHAELRASLERPGLYTENDLRFLDSVLLERFHRHLEARGSALSQLTWHVYKNDRSGVWMADYDTEYDALPRPSGFHAKLEKALKDNPGTRFWVHLELWNGAAGGDLYAQAGILQLRARTDGDNGKVSKAAQAAAGLHDGEVFMKRPNRKAKSFGILKSPLRRRELVFDTLLHRLTAFYGRFGSFEASETP